VVCSFVAVVAEVVGFVGVDVGVAAAVAVVAVAAAAVAVVVVDAAVAAVAAYALPVHVESTAMKVLKGENPSSESPGLWLIPEQPWTSMRLKGLLHAV